MLKDLKIFINTIKNYQTNILTRMNKNIQKIGYNK